LVFVLKGITKDKGVQERGRCFGVSEESNRKLREIHNEELHDFYFPPKIIRLIK